MLTAQLIEWLWWLAGALAPLQQAFRVPPLPW